MRYQGLQERPDRRKWGRGYQRKSESELELQMAPDLRYFGIAIIPVRVGRRGGRGWFARSFVVFLRFILRICRLAEIKRRRRGCPRTLNHGVSEISPWGRSESLAEGKEEGEEGGREVRGSDERIRFSRATKIVRRRAMVNPDLLVGRMDRGSFHGCAISNGRSIGR